MRALRRLLGCVLLIAAAALPVTTAPASATPPAPNCGGVLTLPKSGGGTWQCSFAEEFAGSALDATWAPVTSSQSGLAYGGGCFTNWPGNISVSDGYLHLTAREESTPFTCITNTGVITTRYSTGQIASTGHFAQQYGVFAVRAKFPQATVAGLQSSLWMWPQNLATTGLHGEIDIAEEYSSNPTYVIPYVHYDYDPNTTNIFTGTNVATRACRLGLTDAFHTYVAEWTHSTITIYIDGAVCLTDNLVPSGTSPFDQPFFVALSQALGSGSNAFQPGVTPLPATTLVDWVRAWH